MRPAGPGRGPRGAATSPPAHPFSQPGTERSGRHPRAPAAASGDRPVKRDGTGRGGGGAAAAQPSPSAGRGRGKTEKTTPAAGGDALRLGSPTPGVAASATRAEGQRSALGGGPVPAGGEGGEGFQDDAGGAGAGGAERLAAGQAAAPGAAGRPGWPPAALSASGKTASGAAGRRREESELPQRGCWRLARLPLSWAARLPGRPRGRPEARRDET